jgi:hypothetical protein
VNAINDTTTVYTNETQPRTFSEGLAAQAEPPVPVKRRARRVAAELGSAAAAVLGSLPASQADAVVTGPRMHRAQPKSQGSPRNTVGYQRKEIDSHLGALRRLVAKARASAAAVSATMATADSMADVQRAIGQLRLAQEDTLAALGQAEGLQEAAAKLQRLL